MTTTSGFAAEAFRASFTMSQLPGVPSDGVSWIAPEAGRLRLTLGPAVQLGMLRNPLRRPFSMNSCRSRTRSASGIGAFPRSHSPYEHVVRMPLSAIFPALARAMTSTSVKPDSRVPSLS